MTELRKVVVTGCLRSGDRGGRRDCQSRQHLGGQHIEVAAPQTLNSHHCASARSPSVAFTHAIAKSNHLSYWLLTAISLHGHEQSATR